MRVYIEIEAHDVNSWFIYMNALYQLYLCTLWSNENKKSQNTEFLKTIKIYEKGNQTARIRSDILLMQSLIFSWGIASHSSTATAHNSFLFWGFFWRIKFLRIFFINYYHGTLVLIVKSVNWKHSVKTINFNLKI